MKLLIPIIAAAALAITATGASLAPANAASSFSVQIGSGNSGYDDHRGFERRGDYGYYNGHRGSHTQRPGYRQYNGYWFPPAAFAFGAIAGAIIGSQINSNNDNGNYDGDALPARHVAWCEDHYRSYRLSDNSFQPFNGSRQVCVSPDWG